MKIWKKASRPRRGGPAWGRCVVPIAIMALAPVIGGCGSSSNAPTGAGGGNGSRGTASFFTPATPGGTPVRGGVLTVDHNEAITTLDPIMGSQPNELQVDAAVFDQLFEYVRGSTEPQPALAESYTLSPDHLTYTFHIRPHVYFSNGEPVTAEDVAYSLKRFWLPTASYGTNLLAHKGWESVTATGPLTVKLQLGEQRLATIGNLGLVQMSIVPRKVVEQEGEKQFALHPVGSGPFMVKSVSPGYPTVTLVRNPHYWRAGKPYLDGLVFNQVVETNARILAVRSGAADVAQAISFAQVAGLEKTSGVRMMVRPQYATDPVFLDNGRSPFNDVKVRLALNYATPRETIIKSVFKGMGEPANDPLGHVQDWDPSVPPFEFNIQKAKQLLKESTAPNGFSATIMVPSGEPDASLVASILQSTWGQLGVHMQIQAVEPTAFITNWLAEKYQVAILPDEQFGIEQYPPDLSELGMFDSPDSGGNGGGTGFHSPRATKLIREAIAAPSEAARQRRFGELQRLVTLEEAPMDVIAELPSRTLVSDAVHGFDVLPGNFMPFYGVWLQK
jgi:peptide/nickel transport system substrate-binding protein